MNSSAPLPESDLQQLQREASLLRLTRSMGFCNARYVPIANKAVAHLGLSEASTWPLLAVSRYGDGHRQMVIANILGIKAPSLTRPLDHLEREGLIEPLDKQGRLYRVVDAARLVAPKAGAE